MSRDELNVLVVSYAELKTAWNRATGKCWPLPARSQSTQTCTRYRSEKKLTLVVMEVMERSPRGGKCVGGNLDLSCKIHHRREEPQHTPVTSVFSSASCKPCSLYCCHRIFIFRDD